MLKQLGSDVFNYQVMAEVQANKYTAADGSKPFSAAPDSLQVSCSWKTVWSHSSSVTVHIKTLSCCNRKPRKLSSFVNKSLRQKKNKQIKIYLYVLMCYRNTEWVNTSFFKMPIFRVTQTPPPPPETMYVCVMYSDRTEFDSSSLFNQQSPLYYADNKF